MAEDQSDLERWLAGIKVAIDYVQPFAVIYIVSLLELALQEALVKKMRPISEKFKERIFENYGPVSSLASRMDLAWALSVIDDDIFADLKVIKALRNEFAHPKGRLLHLETEAITKILKTFKGYDKSKTPGKNFLLRSAVCLEALHFNNHEIIWRYEKLRNYFGTASAIAR